MYTHLKARKNPCFSLLSLDKKGGKWKERVERDIDLVEGKNMAYVFCDALQPKTEKLIAVFVSLSLSLSPLLNYSHKYPFSSVTSHSTMLPSSSEAKPPTLLPNFYLGPFFWGFPPSSIQCSTHIHREKEKNLSPVSIISYYAFHATTSTCLFLSLLFHPFMAFSLKTLSLCN